ncbi:MAG: nicotinate (nicotinamide) nucleotide adenylyltransferase [Thermoflavifilum sp.]|nr:nicotinate (nicotinamide) nucleotide adenylyltransferase [Thermoflavifilum sp.]MCL6512919.1 nicotinate (nicotinamide) nucleotide adenylyltransferase [Alicyclobacillus sp.]
MGEVILFGGTFDPPHVGHLLMARLALEQTQADAIWFIPAADPPHKMAVTPLDFQRRVRMVERLIEGQERMVVCRIEEGLERPSYTLRTVRALQSQYPACNFRFLMGADSLASLPTWYGARELCERIPLLVAQRTGFDLSRVLQDVRSRLPALRVETLEMPILDVSSSWLRDRHAHGLPLCHLVPPAVLAVWDEGS